MRSLRESWTLGGLTIPNRVVLAPLAGIGNWFVRLQAKRYGAGLAVSEMVSSFAVHYGNRKTLDELLTIHPDERAGGPVSVQLFGHDPEIMRSAAATVARAGADIIDLNMGCPVPKVCKTGAGAALLGDPDTAVAVARAAREGSGPARSPSSCAPAASRGRARASRSRTGSSTRPGWRASASTRARPPCATRATPDYDLAKELVDALPVPVIVSGGLDAPDHIRWVLDHTGAAAVMLARGSLGNPWLFAQLLDEQQGEPTREEILDELDWVVARAVEHLGEERGARYLRKFFPWYLSRLGEPRSTLAALQCANDLEEQRETPAAAALPCCAARQPSRLNTASVKDAAPMQKDVLLTPEGLENLKKEIEHLSTEKRREVAERIKEARDFGDISENSEYDDAKNEQAMLEARIATLEDKLRSASVIDASELDNEVVRVGSLVNVKDETSGKSLKYTIVGSTEANPGENKLSNESPVGKALVGHKRNDEVSVQLPNGKARKLKITKIEVA